MVKRQAQLPTHLSTIQRYGLAVLCVLVALGGSLLLERFHFRDVALPLFLFANAIASWYGGTGPAVLAILLSCVSFDYFFIEPLYTLYISRFDFPYVIVFVSFTSLVAWFSAVRRRIEGELRQARDELEVRPLIDVIPQQVFVFDSDWRPLFANRRELEYTGLTPQESQSKDAVAKLFHPEDLKRLELLRERARVDGAPFEMEARIQGKDGEYRWFLIRDNPYLDEQGRVLRWYGTRTDIDGRKRGEKEMRNLASLVENSTDFIGLASLEGEVLFVNGAGQGMVGLAGNEQVGETKIPDYMAEQNLQRFQNEVLPAVFRDGRWEGETLFKHFQTGASIPMWQHIFFITEEGSGRRLALATICRDITERKRAEAALRGSAEQLATQGAQLHELFEQAPEGIVLLDVEDRVLQANPEFIKIFGYSLDEAIGHHINDLIAPEELRSEAEEYTHRITHGRSVNAETIRRGKDGRRIHVSLLAVPISLPGGQIAEYAIYRDISEQKMVEGELTKQRAQLNELFETIPEAIAQMDLHDVIIRVNPEFSRIFGYSPEEAVGRQLNELVAPGELRGEAEDFTRRVIGRGETLNVETVRRRKDGSCFPVSIVGVPVSIAEDQIGEYAIYRDITERKRSEERFQRAQAELAHVARLTTMGELAASIAHEVNQPISGVVMNGNACLRWLEGDSPNLDEAREAARRIVRDGKRAGDVIARIRALATKTTTAKGPMDMNEAIRAVMDLVRDELFRNRVTLQTEFADDLSPVLGDRVQLQQVILNLVMNGVEAMSTVGEQRRELVIRTQNDGTDHVRVTVRDSGIGLDLQSKERIFDAFYTTKSGGMGMGLSISRSIVQSHGGRLWAVATDGPGTTFQFTVEKHHVAARRSVAEG